MYKICASIILSAITANYTPSFLDLYYKNQLLEQQSHYHLQKTSLLKNSKYDKKDIPVYILCKEGKTIQTSDTITVFVHGYFDTYRQAYFYIKNPNYHNDIFTSDCLVTFDFADSGKQFLSPGLRQTSLAQDNEMYRLHKVLEYIKKFAKEGTKILLYGVSRGASTIITMLSQYHHPEVSLIILESPFAQLQDVVDNIIKKPIIRSLPYIKKISMPLACLLLSCHKINGIKPLKVVTKLPKNLPILIVATKNDALIPYTSTQTLYTILQDHDYTDVDFYLFNYARHARLAVDKNHSLLQNAIHTFYEKYNFPHNKKYPKMAPGHYL